MDRGDAIDTRWVTQSRKAQIHRLQVDRVNNSRIFFQRGAKDFQERAEERQSLKDKISLSLNPVCSSGRARP